MEVADEGSSAAAEEFRVWKKNSPFLYDLVISHALEWPSLTVQWLPSTSANSHSSSPIQRLILGTHTSEDMPNFLMISDVQFLSPGHLADDSLLKSPEPVFPNVQIKQRIRHEGEVNRARHMPQNPSLIATKTCGSEVHVFDIGKRTQSPPGGDTGRPDFLLRGHSTEGYGLAWNSIKEGYLLSGSYDSKICLWDMGIESIQGKYFDPKDVFEAHKAAVEDVAWHSDNENMFGSVSDDHHLMLWDLRSPRKPEHSAVAHEDEVNSLSFNPFNEWILATASADSSIKLFDLGKLTSSLHTFCSHTGPAVQVEWSPHHETLLASSSEDKRLMVWDLCRIGDEQNEGEAEDGPPELLFAHGGHTAMISEFSWNPEEPWVIASVAEDNILQVWQMAESIYRDGYHTKRDGDAYAIS